MKTDNDTQVLTKAKDGRNTAIVFLAIVALVAIMFAVVASWQKNEGLEAWGQPDRGQTGQVLDLDAPTPARPATADETEKRKAVLIVKEVDGNTTVDIGEYLGACSENGEGICIDDFDSVKVCLIESGVTRCGVYGASEWVAPVK